MKLSQSVLVVLLSVSLLVCIAVSVQAKSFPPLPEALDAMEDDDNATVLTEQLPFAFFNPDYFVFEPTDTVPTKGFIFYPGGLVDPRAYAPPAHALAAAGYLTIIVSMPFDLAPFGWGRAHHILRQYDSIQTWAIGGHSVGGSFACAFTKQCPSQINGVVLWASWPSDSFSLADSDIQAISIYGTKDGYPEDIESGAQDLPPDAEFIQIEGGNHTQFGYYDTSPDPQQPHDNPAEITRAQQQEQIIRATVDFLDRL
jgi:acetyl esterase/lipase